MTWPVAESGVVVRSDQLVGYHNFVVIGDYLGAPNSTIIDYGPVGGVLGVGATLMPGSVANFDVAQGDEGAWEALGSLGEHECGCYYYSLSAFGLSDASLLASASLVDAYLLSHHVPYNAIAACCNSNSGAHAVLAGAGAPFLGPAGGPDLYTPGWDMWFRLFAANGSGWLIPRITIQDDEGLSLGGGGGFGRGSMAEHSGMWRFWPVAGDDQDVRSVWRRIF